jgi:hypothetical protein
MNNKRKMKKKKKKPLAIALSGAVRVDGGGDQTNVQRNAIRNCHSESPDNEYILIKMETKHDSYQLNLQMVRTLVNVK